MPRPLLYLVRHGDTAWTDSHQHTGRTDLPLNDRGVEHAGLIRQRLAGMRFGQVFVSPLQRARRTCALAGFADGAVVDDDLLEWDYGRYEGKLTTAILAENPGWDLFRDGCPEGETPDQVAARADRFLERYRGATEDIAAFSSGHILRMVAARWLGLPPAAGRGFYLAPASLSILGYEHDRDPVVRLWNAT